MKLCRSCPVVIVEPVDGSGISRDEAVSSVVCSIDWSVLTVNIIRLCGLHGYPQLIISSSYTNG